MQKRIYWFILCILLIGGASLLAGWMHKTITIFIDGQSRTISTWAFDVRGALAGADVLLGKADLVVPDLSVTIQEGQTIHVRRARWVNVGADGQIHQILTAELIPAYWLAQLGISLSEGDQLISQGAIIDPLQPTEAQTLQVQRQFKIALIIDGQTEKRSTTALTVAEALWEAGLIPRRADVVEPPLQTAITEGLQIRVRRARSLELVLEDGEIEFSSAGQTVGEALADAGLVPQSLDYTFPAETEAIPENGRIHLVRVREEILLEQTPLPFETRYEAVGELEIDSQKILEGGEYGMTVRRTRLRYEDSVEVSRQIEDEWVARPPQERVIGYGTLLVPRTADTPDGPITYWRALTMWATSYRPANTGNITASGLPVKKGLAAVDRRYIPFFTRLYIPGYGEAVAADTGGGVRGRMIDLAYSDNDYVPWHQYVTVYFLWPPPENIVYVIP